MSWPTASLGELAQFVNGAAFRPEDWGTEGLPIIRIQNLTDSRKPFNRTSREVSDKIRARKGDLLVSWSATLGVFVWDHAEDGLVNQHIFRVIPDMQVVDRDYLRHVLHGALEEMGKHSHGATMQHVNRGEFLATRVPLPPLPEQRRIASILDQTDGLRLLRRSTIRALEALLSTLSIDISKAEDWPLATLGSLAELQGGLTVNQRRHDYRLQTEYLRVANVMRGEMRLGEIKVVGVTEAELARVVLHHGDVLVVEGHGNLGEVGRAAMWRGASTKMVHQNHLIRVRALPARLNSTFLESVLNSSAGRRHFHSVAKTTSGLNTINMADVRSFAIKVPPLEVQQAFAQEVMRVADAQALHREHLTKLDELFASLQDRAFKGEL